MSNYTTELRYIIDSGFDLGLKDYSIFSEEYRQQLNQKIFNHYYFHEIGFETANRFKHYLNATMNEIMPLYNQLLKSELIAINPLLSFERVSNSSKDVDTTSQEDMTNTTTKNVDNTTNQNINNSTSLDNVTTSATDETQTRETDTSQNTNINSSKNVDGNNTSTDNDVFYDTPNGSLGNITDSTYATTVNKKDGTNTIDENEILSSNEGITKDEDITTIIDSDTQNTTKTDTTSKTDNTTINNIEDITSSDADNTKTSNLKETNIITENGFEVPLSELVLKYRETFLNVDLQIINELKDLFMMIY